MKEAKKNQQQKHRMIEVCRGKYASTSGRQWLATPLCLQPTPIKKYNIVHTVQCTG